ncbi:MAG: hypothetical protein GY796_20035, partial [Chloroflexi bacterium]|nr:hypothetical protein [Chloroflexota bacterium]
MSVSQPLARRGVVPDDAITCNSPNRNRPVKESGCAITCSGVPAATNLPSNSKFEQMLRPPHGHVWGEMTGITVLRGAKVLPGHPAPTLNRIIGAS